MEEIMTEDRRNREVRMPMASVLALAAAAERHGEPVAASVRSAGRTTGEELARELSRTLAFSQLDSDDFWSVVNAETAARGLGTFEWHRDVGGLAQLIAYDAVDDAAGPGPREGPCQLPFTEGLLEGLLGAAAGEVIGVVPAPSDGGLGARFVIGAPVLLRHVRIRLDSGLTLDEALEGL